MAVWTVYATWGIATRLCELTELCEGCVSVKSQKSRSKETVLRLGSTVKMSVATCILRPLRKTCGLAQTRKSWSWRCTAKDSYINDTTMAMWTIYATWGITTRLCELTELCEGCVECTELLKANDHVLLSLGTFVHVLSEHSVLCLVFSVLWLYFFSKNAEKKLLPLRNWP